MLAMCCIAFIVQLRISFSFFLNGASVVLFLLVSVLKNRHGDMCQPWNWEILSISK